MKYALCIMTFEDMHLQRHNSLVSGNFFTSSRFDSSAAVLYAHIFTIMRMEQRKHLKTS